MMCFRCPKDFDNVDAILSHIQNRHDVKGETRCICTLCFNIFGDFSVFKTHIESCSKKGMVTNMVAYNAIIGFEYNEELENFKDCLQNNALHLALKMCARPNFPRNAAFDVVADFTIFIHQITDGIKKVLLSDPEKTSTLLEKLLHSVECAFNPINTECKLVTLLNRRKLTEETIKIDVALNKRIDPGVKAYEEYSDESDEEDADEGAVGVTNAIIRPKCTLVIMPLAHQIKQFFELPNVFDKVQAHIAEIQSHPALNHFIKGSVWRKKLSNYGEDQIVFPYNFYGDGVQLNNPLGPHTEAGLENFNYITFPSIPFEYQSRLKNIMVAALYEEKTIKTYGIKAVYSHVIRELASLAFDGIVLNVNNKEIKVFFVMGICEGDNKEINRTLDFPNSHSANYYCRFCRMIKSDMERAIEEKIELRRTEENYNEDVVTNNMTLTGVKDWSIFNTVPYFHVVTGSPNDLTHDLLEGTLPYGHKNALEDLIFDQNLFTVDQLNERIVSFNYGPDNCANKPTPITENLKKKKTLKVKMNAAEMFNFTQNLTLIIGDLIPEEDEDGGVNPVWEFVKNVVKLLDVSFLPWYYPEDIAKLRSVPKLVNEEYQELFEELKPKFHYLTHFATNTERYGPLRYVQTIRKEGKHRELKMYTKNTSNRLNISLSVSKKVQYSNALRVHSSEGLNDVITTTKLHKDSIKNKAYFRNIRGSVHKDAISARECNFAGKMVVNGITYIADSWLPDFTDKEKPVAYRIGDIVAMDVDDISSVYFICKVYDKISYQDHFVAYSVDLGSVQSHLKVIRLSEYIVQHQHPVLTHNINGKEMFRCKRF